MTPSKCHVMVFGRTGQVARELERRTPAGVRSTFVSRAEADFTDPDACVARLNAARPDCVINAAAYTDVDRAEEEEALAQIINGVTPGALARTAADLEIPFLHVSTDYVFDGSGVQPWHEQDVTDPLGAYGRSKLAGEKAVAAADGLYFILRTSWVVSAHGKNFLKTMDALSHSRNHLRVVGDQVGGPTPASDIADVLWTIAKALCGETPPAGGTYHYSGTPDVSWADFAREIFFQTGAGTTVEDIATSEYRTSAVRPRNSRLDCTALQRDFGILRPNWRHGITLILKDLKESSR